MSESKNDIFVNFYDCPCGTRWNDHSEYKGDYRCPDCETTCSPSDSVKIDDPAK